MPRMEKPARFVSDFYFDGMRDLDCVACATDTLWQTLGDTPEQGDKMLDIAARKGLDGYVVEYKVTVAAIAKIDREAGTIEIYDAEKAGVNESLANGKPMPLAEFARLRGIELAIEEDDRHNDCACGMCG